MGKSGELSLQGIDDNELKGKNVLIVEDIFDTGKTLMGLKKAFNK